MLTTLLNVKGAQSQQVMVNAFYCCDLSVLLHSQLQEREQIIQQNMNMQNRDLMRFCNYAPPDYLLPPCDLNTDPQYLIQTRKQFLKELQQAKGHILDQYLCRYYTLLETQECGIDLASLVPDQFLVQAKKLAKGKISAFELRNIASGQNVACSKGTDGEFLLSNLKIRDDLQNQPVIVFAVTTADNNLETVLQEPCNPEEFMGYKFKQSDNYQQFDVHMRFNFPKQHLLYSLQNNANNISSGLYQNNTKGGNKQIQFKNQRISLKGSKNNTETEEHIYQRFPWIFPNNFNEYYTFLQNQNICKSANHSLEMDSAIKVKDQQDLFKPNKKFIQQLQAKKFWSNLKAITEQIISAKNIQISGEQLKILTSKLISTFADSIRYEYDELGDKPNYSQLFDYPGLFMIVQGIYCNFLQITSPMTYLIQPFIQMKLNVQNLMMSSMNLVRGIEQLLQHRIAVNFNASYLSLESETNFRHLISPFYTAWAMTSQFGYGLLEYFKIVKQIKPLAIQQALSEGDQRHQLNTSENQSVESVFEHSKYIVEYLQTLTLYQIRSVNQEPLSPLNEKSLAQLNDIQLGNVTDQQKLNVDNSVAYDFKTINDYLIGIPCVPTMQQDQLLSCNPLNSNFCAPECTDKQEQYIDLMCDYLVGKYHMDISSGLNKRLQQDEDECDEIIDEIVALAQLPSSGPLRLLQTGDQDLFLAPTTSYGADLCVVQRLDRLKAQLRNCGYDTQLFELQESSVDQLAGSRVKENQEQQKQSGIGLVQQFGDQLLGAENCVQFLIQGTSHRVVVPKLFIDQDVKYFWEFVQKLNDQRLSELGLDKQIIGTLADVDRFQRFFRPGIVFDNEMKTFVYMPLVLAAGQSLQSQFLRLSGSLSRESELLQNLIFAEAPQGSQAPGNQIQASLLEALPREYLPQKLINKLNDAIKTKGSVKQLLSDISRQMLNKHDFERLLAELLSQDVENRHKISLNFDLDSLKSEIGGKSQQPHLLIPNLHNLHFPPHHNDLKIEIQNRMQKIVQEEERRKEGEKEEEKVKDEQNNLDESIYYQLNQRNDDLLLMELVLNIFNDLDNALSSSTCNVSKDECNFINNANSVLEQINANKSFLIGKGGIFNNYNVHQANYKYEQYLQLSSDGNSVGFNTQNAYNQTFKPEIQLYKLSISQFIHSARQQINHYDLLIKDTFNSKNFVILARLYGLQTAFKLYTGELSPDDPEAATQKFYGFESMKATCESFQALNYTLQNLSEIRDKKQVTEVFASNLKRIRREKEEKNEVNDIGDGDGIPGATEVGTLVQKQDFLIKSNETKDDLTQSVLPSTMNPDLKRLYPLDQFHEAAGTKIMAPLFKVFGAAESRGFAPLVDIYGRVLRTPSPYSLEVVSSVKDDPIQLETEAPPAPAAAGEESASQSLIDFWENVKNKFFQLPDERIRALTAPLYCLEEREIEFLAVPSVQTNPAAEQAKEDAQNGISCNNYAITPKDQKIGECRCNELSAVLYPPQGPAQQQLDPQMRGIYYLSPYYIPPLNSITLPRAALFKRFAQRAITDIAQLICEPLQPLSAQGQVKQSSNQQTHVMVEADILKQAFEMVGALFLSAWPTQYQAEHIKGLLPEEFQNIRRTNQELHDLLATTKAQAKNLLAQEIRGISAQGPAFGDQVGIPGLNTVNSDQNNVFGIQSSQIGGLQVLNMQGGLSNSLSGLPCQSNIQNDIFGTQSSVLNVSSVPNIKGSQSNVKNNQNNVASGQGAQNDILTQKQQEQAWRTVFRKMVVAETKSSYGHILSDTNQSKVSLQLRQFYYNKDLNQKLQQLKYIFAIALALRPDLNIFDYGDPQDPLRPAPMPGDEGVVPGQMTLPIPKQIGNLTDSLPNTLESKTSFDPILLELIKKQNELYKVEQENLQANARLSRNLRELKCHDVRNDLHELFATAVTAAWAKLCAGDRAKDAGRVSHDQLALGGFETNGPRGDYSASAKFAQIAKEHHLDFGDFNWDRDCFDIADIVEFD